MPRNILIIGGTKFVGKLLVDLFLKNGDHVTILSRSQPEQPDVRYISGDRENADDLANWQKSLEGEQFDVTYDMCAYTPEHAQSLFPIIQGKTKRLVFFSSAAVYERTEIFPLKETSTVGPHESFGDYGTNKAAIENFYKKKCNESQVQLTIMRPHYILGPGDYFERHLYILSRIENGKAIYIPGDGQALVQFVLSTDVAKLFYEIPFKQRVPIETLNIAGKELITLSGFVRLFADAYGAKADIKLTDYESYGLRNDRFYDDLFLFPNLHLILDTQRLEQEYRFTATPLKSYINLLVQDWMQLKQDYTPQYKEEKLFGKKSGRVSA